MTTKIPAELSSTPGIVDGSNATAITIDSSENVGIGATTINEKLEVKGAVGYQASNSTNRWSVYTYTDNTLRFNYNGSGSDEIIINSSGGLSFDGTTTAANTLDDYEEGTWTPTLLNSSVISLSTYSANYTKIGRLVVAGCYIDVAVNSDSNHFQIGGLPYGAIGSNYYAGGTMGYGGSLDFSSYANPLVINGGSYIYFHKNSSSAIVLNSEINAATDPRFIIQMIYMTV